MACFVVSLLLFLIFVFPHFSTGVVLVAEVVGIKWGAGFIDDAEDWGTCTWDVFGGDEVMTFA